MKNKKILLTIGATTLLLTACGGSGKTLKCTLDHSDDMAGMGTMKEILEFNYDSKGKTPESAVVKVEVTLNETDYVDLMKTQLETQCTDMKDEGATCNVSIDGKKVTFKAEMDKDSMGAGDFVSSEDETLDTLKTSLIESGYTCE